MRIACDLDGVLSDILPELQLRIKKQLGIDVEVASMYDLNDIVDKKWIDKTFDDEWLWSRALPYQNNIDTLKQWGDQGHEIHVVTGRPSKGLAIVTRGWLKRYGVEAAIAFEPVMHKVDYLKKKEIPVMFEDLFFEANKIGAFGIRSFIVRRPWNKDYEQSITNPLVSFVENLAEANQYIKEMDNVGG